MEWSRLLFGGDCYYLLSTIKQQLFSWFQRPPYQLYYSKIQISIGWVQCLIHFLFSMIFHPSIWCVMEQSQYIFMEIDIFYSISNPNFFLFWHYLLHCMLYFDKISNRGFYFMWFDQFDQMTLWLLYFNERWRIIIQCNESWVWHEMSIHLL